MSWSATVGNQLFGGFSAVRKTVAVRVRVRVQSRVRVQVQMSRSSVDVRVVYQVSGSQRFSVLAVSVEEAESVARSASEARYPGRSIGFVEVDA